MTIKIRFEPRDLWIGCYWTHETRYGNVLHPSGYWLWTRWKGLRIFICIIPMFPIVIDFEKAPKGAVRETFAK